MWDEQRGNIFKQECIEHRQRHRQDLFNHLYYFCSVINSWQNAFCCLNKRQGTMFVGQELPGGATPNLEARAPCLWSPLEAPRPPPKRRFGAGDRGAGGHRM